MAEFCLNSRVGNNGLARQILPQARIWRSQILARIPRILELDSARILTWMPPKLDYNPGIRGCIQPCSGRKARRALWLRAVPHTILLRSSSSTSWYLLYKLVPDTALSVSEH